MKIMFVNSREPQCGVAQYGANLFTVIAGYHSDICYVIPESREMLGNCLHEYQPDVVIYNWQAGIGGWMAGAPFKMKAKQVLVYHDLEARFDDFDAILFSDPTMQPHGNWHPIGRPLRGGAYAHPPPHEIPIIGINGFIGAWSEWALETICSQFDRAHIRLHLPAATYGDSDGAIATRSAREATARMLSKGFTFEVSHNFLSFDILVAWLARNDINCYIRNPNHHWRGVSSSCDAAMDARRPIAINSCNAFRHLHDCSPSIMVEHRTIPEIMASGLSPLAPKYTAWHPDVVANQVLKVLESVVK